MEFAIASGMNESDVCFSLGSFVKYSLADNMRQGKKILTKWFTGREWPVNCMTVISTRWRSHIPFQRWRKWHIPMASNRAKSRRLAWLTWRSHRAATKGCTEREWPVNCMSVISARRRSHMPFQRWRKWHIPIARYRKKLRGRGGVSISPRGSLKVI